MDVRVAVMGGGGVGKSCLTIQYVQGFFIDVYDPTIEDCWRTQKRVDDEVALMQILDTAGQDVYHSMRDSWMRVNDVFLLVFSLTDRHSFEEIDEYYKQLLRVKDAEPGDVPVVLIANKSDLCAEQKVTCAEAEEKATSMGAKLVRTSAKEATGVACGFEQAVREYRRHREEASGAGRRDGTRRAGAMARLAQLCTVM